MANELSLLTTLLGLQRQKERDVAEDEWRKKQLKHQEDTLAATLKRIELDQQKRQDEINKYEKTQQELKVNRETMADFIAKKSSTDIEAKLRLDGFDPDIMVYSPEFREEKEKQADDMYTEAMMKVNAARTGAIEYMKENFGQDRAAEFFGFDQPTVSDFHFDKDGYVEVVGGKPVKTPWANMGEELTERQLNARAFGKMMQDMNIAAQADTPISVDAAAQAMALAPDDNTREYIHYLSMSTRKVNNLLTPYEKAELQKLEAKMRQEGDKIMVMPYTDKFGNQQSRVISLRAMWEGTAKDGVILELDKANKMRIPDSVRAAMTQTYMDQLAGMERLGAIMQSVRNNPRVGYLPQQLFNKVAGWMGRLIDPNFNPGKSGDWGPLQEFFGSADATEQFMTEVEQYFQIFYRKPVTGAQAGMQELTQLRDDFVNKGQAPWMFVARATGIIMGLRDAALRTKKAVETGELPDVPVSIGGLVLDPEALLRKMAGLD